MEGEPSRVLGALRFWVDSPGWSQLETHLLMQAAKVEPVRWDEAMETRPTPRWIVVSPSGRKLLGLLPAAGSGNAMLERFVVMDADTERVVETGFTQLAPEPSARRDDMRLNYALAADDVTLAVAVTEWDQRNLTITIQRVDESAPMASRVLPGCTMAASTPFDHHLQWAPDGRYVAVQVREPHEQWGVSTYDSLLVLDASTLETVLRLDATWLMGSQSWSPEGDALAVEDFREPRLLHVADGSLEKLAWMKPTREDPPRGPEILALLSQRRALVMPLSRTRARFRIADLDTGKGETVASFPIPTGQWPLRPFVSRAWEQLADGAP